MTDWPGVDQLYQVVEHTWPAADRADLGIWGIRDGQGGGKRVSAAILRQRDQAADLTATALRPAEDAMRALGQTLLFMIREGESTLDSVLAEQGYAVIDPVNIYAAPVALLTAVKLPRLSSFDLWPPLAIQKDIWSSGGIGPDRLRIMERVEGLKTTLFGRADGQAAATGFLAIHQRIAMIHALEVLGKHRRKNLGRYLSQHAALWAQGHGAEWLAVLCTQQNAAANALYTSLGMTHVGSYHYRIKEDT